jgi:Fe-S cluster biosynthesis and repair protein YggX
MDVWRDIQTNQPSANDLAGYGMFDQMGNDWFSEYLTDNGYGNAMPTQTNGWHGDATNFDSNFYNLSQEEQDRIRGEAQDAYVSEQLRADPLWGLDVADSSQLEAASADPMSIEAQQRALGNLGQIYEDGGYTDAERAQLQMSQRDAAMGERSQRLAVQQGAQARGMGGGGMEMMGALAAQQGGANRANDWANQIAVAGQQRALQSLQSYGQQAGQMRGQSFQEDATRAAAADAWNQHQTGLISDRQQQLANANQQQFANSATAAAGLTGQLGDWSAYQNELENRPGEQRRETANTFASFFGGGGMGGGGGGG